jgi:hypothetical protein
LFFRGVDDGRLTGLESEIKDKATNELAAASLFVS